MLKGFHKYAALLAAATGVVPAFAASDHASISGVVRDANGVPQMGVMVELLRAGVVATTFTDLHGRYHLDQLRPGIYDVETSAALFLPTLKRRLHLDAGVGPIVNLTLSGLLDESGWTTPQHPAAASDAEDWKWTLRSPANRPMLRLVDDGQESAPRSERPRPAPGARRATLTIADCAGSYGTSGNLIEAVTGRQSADGARSQSLRMLLGSSAGLGVAPFSLAVESTTGRGQPTERHLSAAVRSYPQIRTGAQSGLVVMEIDSAQEMELGSMGALEIGGATQALHSGATLVALRPFAQLSIQPSGAWLVRYRYATSPRTQDRASLTAEPEEAPTLVADVNGRLRTQTGDHHELSLTRSLGRARLQAAAFHDGRQVIVLNAQKLRRAAAQAVTGDFAGSAYDSGSGISHSLSPAFSSTGVRVQLEAPLGEAGTVTALYLNGAGLDGPGRADAAAAALTPRQASAVCVIVQRSLARSGTGVSASYRWQASSLASVVGAYTAPETSPYLGVHLVQRLPSLHAGSVRSQLTIDGTNILAEGYREPLESSGEAVMMSAVREVRAGLAVTF